MKATGIVRRIDELGRVVVPKEIRRTLRIREGDPLEIFTDKNGEIILKKYSPIGELSEHAQELVQSLSGTFSLPAAICDKDTYVASAGMGKRDIGGRPVSREIEQAMLQRSRILHTEPGEERFSLISGEDPAFICTAMVVLPVVSQGNAIGAVLLFSQKPDVSVDPSGIRACETVAAFLGRQMDQ